METKEFNFKGTTLNGFLMLFVVILLPILAIWGIYKSIVMFDIPSHGWLPTVLLIVSILFIIATLFILGGFIMLEPNTARVTTWFGKYSGTFNRTGFSTVSTKRPAAASSFPTPTRSIGTSRRIGSSNACKKNTTPSGRTNDAPKRRS